MSLLLRQLCCKNCISAASSGRTSRTNHSSAADAVIPAALLCAGALSRSMLGASAIYPPSLRGSPQGPHIWRQICTLKLNRGTQKNFAAMHHPRFGVRLRRRLISPNRARAPFLDQGGSQAPTSVCSRKPASCHDIHTDARPRPTDCDPAAASVVSLVMRPIRARPKRCCSAWFRCS